MPPATLAIDFGTSNSAVGFAPDGRPRLIEMAPGEKTLPTAVFFDADSGEMRIGHAATRALIEGSEGRYMRALKSLLGTALLRETRHIHGRKLDFIDIIARFLASLKSRAEAATGQHFDQALSGRPVRFHSQSDARNRQAARDLEECYLRAGFSRVSFLFEPEAALRTVAPAPGLGLIVDIGGGTSDYTVFDQPAGSGARPRILASHGLRLGGTDFDRQLSIAHVMPLLGRGSAIRNSFGSGTLPAPERVFNDLATWQLIPFQYGPDTMRLVRDLARHAAEPQKLARLLATLENQLGHDLAFAVERAKLAANDAAGAAAGTGPETGADTGAKPWVDLSLLEPGLAAPLAADALEAALAGSLDQIVDQARHACALADVAPQQLSRVVLVGGSSLLRPLQDRLRAAFPAAQLESANALTAVADGLALAAA